MHHRAAALSRYRSWHSHLPDARQQIAKAPSHLPIHSTHAPVGLALGAFGVGLQRPHEAVGRAVGAVLAHHGLPGGARGVHAGQQRAVQQPHLVVDALDLGLALVGLLAVEVCEQEA